ncbi:MAG: Uncharacterised protein [Bacteroidota bacterium]|nr:MAG: Uncharacterised protein [Bacteroidota bacterium]
MSKNIFKKSVLIAAILFLAACKKDDPKIINEEEEFSRVVITVTNEGDQSSEQYTFEVEGHDHADETESTEDTHEDHLEVELAPNSSYLFEIRFYNDEDPNNPEDVTQEIIDEADDHHVFYELTDGANISIESGTGDTMDSNSNALNLITRWTTTAAGVADVIAYLIHEPSTKTGTTRNDFGGATDVELEFEAHVE